MAKDVLDNCYVSVDSVDLSDHVRSITLPLTRAEIDKTCMTDDSVARLSGLKDASVTITWTQDFAASKVDATMWDVYDTDGGATTIVVRPTTAAVGSTNPSYTLTAVLTEYTALNGSAGDLSEATTTFLGNGDIARATT